MTRLCASICRRYRRYAGLGYTLRREVGHDYAVDIARYLDLQRDTIIDLSRRFDLHVAAQGEIEEKKILWGRCADA